MAQPRPTLRPLIRGKLWIDLDGKTALTEAGADLLEQIEACGSLSGAARRLGFAYRRAWLLIDSMNRAWPEPLVITTTGGRRGGGARITDHGQHILRAYRDLQLRIEHLLDDAGDAFVLAL